MCLHKAIWKNNYIINIFNKLKLLFTIIIIMLLLRKPVAWNGKDTQVSLNCNSSGLEASNKTRRRQLVPKI